jgi:deoxycytidine triphosphate deaminase
VREAEGANALIISYGVSAATVTMFAARDEFKVFTNINSATVRSRRTLMRRASSTSKATVCIIPPNSFALGAHG